MNTPQYPTTCLPIGRPSRNKSLEEQEASTFLELTSFDIGNAANIRSTGRHGQKGGNKFLPTAGSCLMLMMMVPANFQLIVQDKSGFAEWISNDFLLIS